MLKPLRYSIHRYSLKLPNGQYSFRVRSTSLATVSAFSDQQFIKVNNQMLSAGGLLIFTAFLIVMGIATFVGVIAYRRYGWRFGTRANLTVSRQNLTSLEEAPAADEEFATFERSGDGPYEEVPY